MDGFGAGEAQQVIPIVNEEVRLEVRRVRRRQEPWLKWEGLIRARAMALGIEMKAWCKKCSSCR